MIAIFRQVYLKSSLTSPGCLAYISVFVQDVNIELLQHSSATSDHC